jgi:hypothetical protein
MSYFPSLHMGTDIALVGVTNYGISPHPVPLPMGEGTPEIPPRLVQGSLLPWGEGQDEGSEFHSWQDGATAPSYPLLSRGRFAS